MPLSLQMKKGKCCKRAFKDSKRGEAGKSRLLFEPTRKSFYEHVLKSCLKETEIVPARLGEKAVPLGAVATVLKNQGYL